ncbi:hypothetical protein BC830DRAFT_1222792 [Chytriomyces sp. MP71]|nr:hypothetical protein BC830DRAFT_1222792 [Chytriomyces sp. MP71]
MIANFPNRVAFLPLDLQLSKSTAASPTKVHVYQSEVNVLDSSQIFESLPFETHSREFADNFYLGTNTQHALSASWLAFNGLLGHWWLSGFRAHGGDNVKLGTTGGLASMPTVLKTRQIRISHSRETKVRVITRNTKNTSGARLARGSYETKMIVGVAPPKPPSPSRTSAARGPQTLLAPIWHPLGRESWLTRKVGDFKSRAW